jgi:hypothetical protein
VDFLALFADCATAAAARAMVPSLKVPSLLWQGRMNTEICERVGESRVRE